MQHLAIRVAWHDARWGGTVCDAPSANPYCVALERVREERDDAYEDGVAGLPFEQLGDRLPPCALESGAFMSPRQWRRRFVHPYRDIPKAQATHGHLDPLVIDVPAYTTFGVPFAWMLRENQERIQDGIAEQLPPDREPPFDSAWVFGRERQEALLSRFFDSGGVVSGSSMVMFYTKHGHPLGDDIPRLIVGVGQITKIRDLRRYPTSGAETYPLWDRLISHSIRGDGSQGFLLPYHEYLQQTGDPEEDVRRRQLLESVVLRPDDDQIVNFSYHTEHAGPDIALGVLVKLLEVIRSIRSHGIAVGNWLAREDWVNEQLAATWLDRGPFPGLGSVLEAVGLRLGTALVFDLRAQGRLRDDGDPWPMVDSLIRGDREPPRKEYVADLGAVRNTWINMGHRRRRLLELLSRFNLTPPQARRWFESRLRAEASIRDLDDADVLSNPYVIAEADLGAANSPPVSLTTIDRGAFPDAAIRAGHPLPADKPVESPIDARRIRAALVAVLRRAEARGDTLLAVGDILEQVEALPLSPKLQVPEDWLIGNASDISPVVSLISAFGKSGERFDACQLHDVRDREDWLSRILRKRSEAPLPSLGAQWEQLLIDSVRANDGEVDVDDVRHRTALAEQAVALERITTRKASVLVGRAGTGKTSRARRLESLQGVEGRRHPVPCTNRKG